MYKLIYSAFSRFIFGEENIPKIDPIYSQLCNCFYCCANYPDFHLHFRFFITDYFWLNIIKSIEFDHHGIRLLFYFSFIIKIYIVKT